MWDQRVRDLLDIWDYRIIPTHVGSTRRNSSQVGTASNHSHACGINSYARKYALNGLESFPRMWDQPNGSMPGHSTSRIIPTHVGSTVIMR